MINVLILQIVQYFVLRTSTFGILNEDKIIQNKSIVNYRYTGIPGLWTQVLDAGL